MGEGGEKHGLYWAGNCLDSGRGDRRRHRLGMYAVVLVVAAVVVAVIIMRIAFVIATRNGENGGDGPRGNDDGEELERRGGEE